MKRNKQALEAHPDHTRAPQGAPVRRPQAHACGGVQVCHGEEQGRIRVQLLARSFHGGHRFLRGGEAALQGDLRPGRVCGEAAQGAPHGLQQLWDAVGEGCAAPARPRISQVKSKVYCDRIQTGIAT